MINNHAKMLFYYNFRTIFDINASLGNFGNKVYLVITYIFMEMLI